ncbi:MAG: hypothetical protein VX160_07600 [Actinomycetota bacterium]|nr:hypothetical protein [Actinomycetota bacterium]
MNHDGMKQTLKRRDAQLARLLDKVQDRIASKVVGINEDGSTLRPAWLERLSAFIASEQERIDREAANDIRRHMGG